MPWRLWIGCAHPFQAGGRAVAALTKPLPRPGIKPRRSAETAQATGSGRACGRNSGTRQPIPRGHGGPAGPEPAPIAPRRTAQHFIKRGPAEARRGGPDRPAGQTPTARPDVRPTAGQPRPAEMPARHWPCVGASASCRSGKQAAAEAAAAAAASRATRGMWFASPPAAHGGVAEVGSQCAVRAP